jgi:DNA-binding NtrC family response regulator
MTESILNNKKLLIVDDEHDILSIVEEEILEVCPDTKIDKVTSYEAAAELLTSKKYDLVVLDIMGVRGFDLLKIALERKFKVTMLTAHALNPEALKKAHHMGAMAYLPKDKIGELVPFLEHTLQHDHKSAWKHLIEKLEDYYTEKFQSADWKDGIKSTLVE